ARLIDEAAMLAAQPFEERSVPRRPLREAIADEIGERLIPAGVQGHERVERLAGSTRDGLALGLAAGREGVVAEVVVARGGAATVRDRAARGAEIDAAPRERVARLDARHQEAARPRAKAARGELVHEPRDTAERGDAPEIRPLDAGRARAAAGRARWA